MEMDVEGTLPPSDVLNESYVSAEAKVRQKWEGILEAVSTKCLI